MQWTSLPLLSPEECRRIIDVLAEAPASNAAVYGLSTSGTVDERVRRVKRLVAPPFIVAQFESLFTAVLPEIAERFSVSVTSFEPPQFLRYETGDFFVAHQDGNTPLIRDDSSNRRVSAIVFLSDRGDYDGGAVRFLGRGDAPANCGSLLAFPSELTHEVTPVERGERFTVVTWYR